MTRYSKLNKTAFTALSLLSLPVMSLAQQTEEPAKSSAGSPLAIVMIIIALILAFVIWGMGHVLITLGRQLLEKNKSSKAMAIVLTLGLTLLSLVSSAQETATTAADAMKPAIIDYGGMNSTGFWTLATVILIELVAICFIMFFINRIQQELLPQSVKKASQLSSWWANLDKKFFTKAVAVEKEADVLLDHDYDGIKELDNSLPPWWKYGFYITIFVGFIYLLNFHVLGYGQNPTQEYESEMEKASIALEIYNSKNADKIDEKNLKMPAQAGIDNGKEIFSSVCWTCHGKQGEGGAGPNLTDNYWIHKGSLTDIYMSIKKGYPDKGMQAWEKNYSPKEILNLSAYIMTLKGTNPPNPKAPQGDLFTEAPATDTAAAMKDTTVVALKDTAIKK